MGGDGGPQNAVITNAFGACQHEGGTFIFGGIDGNGARRDALWFGYDMSFELLSGTGGSGSAAMATAGSTTTGAAVTKSTITDPFKTWRMKTPPKVKRAPVKDLVAASLKQFYANQKSGAQAGAPVASAGGYTAPLFVGGVAPPAQSGSVVAYVPDFDTVTVLYGDTGTSPVHTDPVHVAIYDPQAATWTSGTVDWSPGPGARRHVGYAIRGEHVVFYGGESGGSVQGGLYLAHMEPGALMAGMVPERMDGASADTPGPRRHAVLAFEPVGNGQLGPHGTGYVYLFGGVDAGGTLHNDLWRFSMSSLEWTEVADGSGANAPPPMVAAGMAIVYAPDNLPVPVVYTGYTGSQDTEHWAFGHRQDGGWAPVVNPRLATMPDQSSAMSSPAVTGCFAQDGQGLLVATSCDRSDGQSFQLRPAQGIDELQYEVARRSDGACLRLDGPLLSRTVGDRECAYVAWLTPLSLGACGDDRARFDVEAWGEGFRLRMRFPCTLDGAPAGYDDGSCVDSDATGADVLRIFWCHDGDRERQKLLAPGWPSFTDEAAAMATGGATTSGVATATDGGGPDGGVSPDAGGAP